jgi:short subunit dehydrogenase-like uncharacterized protein
MAGWMVYGANGYAGELVARLAVARGERPVLAGRNGPAVRRLAQELGCESVVIALDDAAALRSALGEVRSVAHCAGPFAVTAAPMVAACIAVGVHYLDITGEIEVVEAVFARSGEATAAGVVLLPGMGFDVVPTDCVASMLYAQLPSATELELAIRAEGGLSRGTVRTSIGGGGGWRRVDGRLVPVPVGEPRRRVPFPSGPRTVSALPLGDLSSAFRSTGIPNVTTYATLPAVARPRLMQRFGVAALRYAPVRAVADAVARWAPSGPSPQARATTRTEVWGEVRDPTGATATMTVTLPNVYDVTADSVVRAVRRIAEVAPGAHTPSQAFGAGYLSTLDGVHTAET